MSTFLDLVNKHVEHGELDQTKITHVSRLPAAGIAWMRFTGYVEQGKQVQPDYMGKPKNPADEVRLTFELLTPAFPKAVPPHPGHVREVEVHKDGVSATKKVCDKINITVTVSGNEKSRFAKLFKAMRAGRENIKHMGQMLGEAFLGTVTIKKSEKSDKEYATLYSDGAWMVRSTLVPNPNTGETARVPVPAPLNDLVGFLWSVPVREHWDSLFIPGEWEKTDPSGHKSMASKNFIQQRMLGAVNFVGSPLQTMLVADDIPVDTIMGAPVAELTEDGGSPDDYEQATPQPADEDTDPEAAALAALGII